MTVDEAVQGDVVVFRLTGEIDVKSAPLIKQRLEERGAAPRPRAVVTLDGLRYIDSAGLGVLVGALKAYAARGGKLVLAAPRPEVRHILQITRLIQHFEIHGTEADAIKALA